MPATLEQTTVRFHVSLNVSDLGRAVDFYRVLFGLEPAKRRADYAKFELAEPPLVLSLEPNRQAPGGSLNHLGFRLPDATSLVELQRRLEMAGIRTQRQEGVECCYARQTKFWVADPDRNLWELYLLEEDIEHRGAGQTLEEMIPAPSAAPREVTWEHRLGDPLPEGIPLADGTATEIRLLGTFNASVPQTQTQRLVQDAFRALQPGGKITIHALVADRPFPKGFRPLPGPAAPVQCVPLETEPLRALEAVSFIGLSLSKFGGAACFTQDGVEMREMLVTASRPGSAPQGQRVVLYKGPFREISDDEGKVYPRGQRVTVSAATWERLRQGPAGEQFTLVTAGAIRGCS